MSGATALFRRLLHVVLPVECGSCGVPLEDDPIPFFCRACWSRLEPIAEPTCPRCGRPFASPVALEYSPAHSCSDCRQRPPAFSRAVSGYVYDGTLRDAITLFKYERKVALAAALGALLRDVAPRVPSQPDLIIPVPLHAARLRERGFNQSVLLADRLATAFGVPLAYTNLIRLRFTPAQTELTRAARLKNLRRAFALRSPDRVAGKRILLVDDVFTTGTTVNECAKMLRKAGAADVMVATLARTV